MARPDDSREYTLAEADAYAAGVRAAAALHEAMAADMTKLAHADTADGMCGWAEEKLRIAAKHREHAAAIRALLEDAP